jgi:hypothetical protein
MKKAIGLTIGLALATLIGCNVKPLPKCDDAEVMSLAKQALSSAPAFKGKFMNFQLGIPGETRYRASPPKRVCRTSLSSTVGNQILFYSVEWQNQKKNIIWVQTMGDHDDGT